MPKTSKVSLTSKKEWVRQVFKVVNKYLKWGVIIGLFTIGIRLSVFEVTEEIRQLAYDLGYSLLALSTILQIWKRIRQLPQLSPDAVNLITGFALTSSIVSFLLYGPSFF